MMTTMSTRESRKPAYSRTTASRGLSSNTAGKSYTADYTRAHSVSTRRIPVNPRSKTSLSSSAVSGTRTQNPTSPQKKTHIGRRLGSQQTVSYRGRRIENPYAVSSKFVRYGAYCVMAIIGGIFVAMWLSGAATKQSFSIDSVDADNKILAAEITSLERNLNNKHAPAALAAEASRLGMVVPMQPGIVEPTVERVEELRAANPAAQAPIVDLNGNISVFSNPSSKPSDTAHVEGLAPQSIVGAEVQSDNENPYPAGQPGTPQQLPQLDVPEQAPVEGEVPPPAENIDAQDNPAPAENNPVNEASPEIISEEVSVPASVE